MLSRQKWWLDVQVLHWLDILAVHVFMEVSEGLMQNTANKKIQAWTKIYLTLSLLS